MTTLTRAELEQSVVPEVRSAMHHFLEGSQGDELKVTVLFVSPAEIWTHISPLKPPRSPPIRIQLAGSPRENAATKDSEWVRQRQALERRGMRRQQHVADRRLRRALPSGGGLGVRRRKFAPA